MAKLELNSPANAKERLGVQVSGTSGDRKREGMGRHARKCASRESNNLFYCCSGRELRFQYAKRSSNKTRERCIIHLMCISVYIYIIVISENRHTMICTGGEYNWVQIVNSLHFTRIPKTSNEIKYNNNDTNSTERRKSKTERRRRRRQPEQQQKKKKKPTTN